MDTRPRPRPDPPPRDPPAWLIGLAVLALAVAAVLWTQLTGRTLTEWMRDVTGALTGR
jgi:hypothetical protein